MMTDSEFEQWCQQLQLETQARQVIKLIRASEPSRRVGGGRHNVSGRYPSRKMGVTIQFESPKVELRFIYLLEHDDNVLEYYDQPPPFKINYQSELGRKLGFFITPDFLVIYKNGFEWVECKTEDKLKKLASQSPNRYLLSENNQWRSPPAEEYPKSLGGTFRLWSDGEINWKLQRNLEFLQDYYIGNPREVSEATTQLIKSVITIQAGLTLSHLINYVEDITRDEIYHLIAQEIIYVDLTNYL